VLILAFGLARPARLWSQKAFFFQTSIMA